MSNFRQFWVGLNMVKGIGAVRLRALLDIFEDAQSAWQAPPEALRSAVWDDDYPMRLRDIGNPPPVLDVCGSIKTEDE